MFSQRERRDLRECLVAAARVDERIWAAAVVGSAATHREDEWSDIDLAFRLAAGLEPADVSDAWTGRMYEDHGAVDHLDVWSESTLFRVFLLSSSMQVDLSFWPWEMFAASGTSFRLLFGEANKPMPSSSPTPETLIGMGWLYALHARSSIARGRNLQALYMVNGVRDHVVSLACLRHGLSAHQGRGVDDLPPDVMETLAETLVRGLRRSELSTAFANAITALINEAEQIDPGLASRLREPARELVRTASGPSGEPAEEDLQ
ncbi:MAG: nucleotidyltransferase domain-containing protein [Actinobacteria bacterium]|nr:nucleotidyltransferase domain-containing protein [Actinomycetota bacterium]